mmetsp:Transcript_17081/g.54850  ORF Transcript_17081/g.54850 Transcript_17081/m.54850 type:complete len:286 (-) Transcript_17081:61-918(-)
MLHSPVDHALHRLHLACMFVRFMPPSHHRHALHLGCMLSNAFHLCQLGLLFLRPQHLELLVLAHHHHRILLEPFPHCCRLPPLLLLFFLRLSCNLFAFSLLVQQLLHEAILEPLQLLLLHGRHMPGLFFPFASFSLLSSLHLGDLALLYLLPMRVALLLHLLQLDRRRHLPPTLIENIREHHLRAQLLHAVRLLVQDLVGPLDQLSPLLPSPVLLHLVDLPPLRLLRFLALLARFLLLLPLGRQCVRPTGHTRLRHGSQPSPPVLRLCERLLLQHAPPHAVEIGR